ncbi:hypothetical protein GWK08_01720 [Leptobacterium flavescens]|uniref:Lipocalin-like domain-containing protein n=1 Tax=Leptobacterium flavescens TaxID=472055 RepID=A0A6P0UGK2_9FLAO|nr:lipocalin family protein [Leptobacterium flavescens]NER12147.1 hypothetical protein [Leptobacterium flavescens]
MKKTILYSILCFFLLACSDNKVQEIGFLEGYWEIEKVEMPDGNSKEYTINQTIDHFKFESDSSGYRKKLQPQLNGNFLTSDDAEAFTISENNGVYTINYKNALSSWTETIRSLNKEQLIITNEANLKYIYKRFEKLEIKTD